MILKNFFKFQEALAESMNDVKQKVTNTIDHMNSVVKRASEMGITVHNLIENRKNQDKIDNIFCESSLVSTLEKYNALRIEAYCTAVIIGASPCKAIGTSNPS